MSRFNTGTIRNHGETDLFDLVQLDDKQSNELRINDLRLVFSYRTLVMLVDYSTTKDNLVTSRQHSKTTTEHINQWIKREDISQPREVSQEELETEAYKRLGGSFI